MVQKRWWESTRAHPFPVVPPSFFALQYYVFLTRLANLHVLKVYPLHLASKGGLSEGKHLPLGKWEKRKYMYAIIRTQKHKTNATIGGMEKHDDRTMDVPNANKDFTHYNKILIGKRSNLIESIDARIEKLKKDHDPRITKDSVRCIEYMMTASPEAFAFKQVNGKLTASKDDQARWTEFVKNSQEFLIQKHGKENIVKFSYHLDETTPHIHAFVVPITKDHRLSAKDFLGGTEKLRELQDEFAEKMKPIGLKRGEKGSKAKHETIQKYYGRVNQAQHIGLEHQQPGPATTYELPKPPVIGRDEWREEQQHLINEQFKQAHLRLSNERSLLNQAKVRLNEERAARVANEVKIKKLEKHIWHLENPELSKDLEEKRKIEKQVLQGKSNRFSK